MTMKKTLAIFSTYLIVGLCFALQSEAINLNKSNGSGVSPRNTEVYGNQLIAKVKIPIQPNKLSAGLSKFRARNIKIGTTNFSLGNNDMKHILSRHHPEYWDGTTKQQGQTFFKRSMGIDNVADSVLSVANQNRQSLSKIGRSSGQVEGIVNGTKYILGVKDGRFHQFYPAK